MFIASNELDIMMITEVIPKAQQNSISYPQLSIKGYDTYVNVNPDEENLGASGIRGVAIYVKCNLVARKLKLNNLFSDQLWVEITLRNNDLLLCGCIYRSPTGEENSKAQSTENVCKVISYAAISIIRV